MDIKKKQVTYIVVNKSTLVVELRDHDTEEVLEILGTGKNLTDATRIATEYGTKKAEDFAKAGKLDDNEPSRLATVFVDK